MYKDYNMNQLVMSLDIEYEIHENDIAHLINNFVESIPEKEFTPFVTLDGRPSYHPKMMLKIILCAYTQGVFSGRKIEAMLKDSLRMMWLAQQQVPSYRTINRFRVNPHTQQLIKTCFIQFRLHLISEKLIEEEAIYIDGTKMEANAQKYTFVWRRAIETNEKKMSARALAIYHELVQEEILPAIVEETPELTEEQMNLMKEKLTEKVEDLTGKIESSSDTNLRKATRSERKPLKQQLKQVTEMIERKEKYREHYEILGERNSYSKTDNDATFMRMKDDHMMNGQLKAGYNIQIATENQYVLGYDIYPNPTDTKTLQPFLNTLTSEFKLSLPPHIVADAGYGSETNYQYILDDLGKVPLITYSMYLKEQTRKHKMNEFHPDNFRYNEEEDYYICPNDSILEFKKYKEQTDATGMKREFRQYECTTSCEQCPLREKCTTSKNPQWKKIMNKNMNWEYFKEEVRTLLSEEETGSLYRKRKIDVEPVFGYLKAILGFTRMSVRGNKAVTNEIGLALMAVNIRKLAKYKSFLLEKTTKKWMKEVLHFNHPFFCLFRTLLSRARKRTVKST